MTYRELYEKGYEIVLGIRNNRKTDSFFKKYTALMFYKVMNLMGAKIPANHSDYRLVSKKALDMMALYPEKALFLRGFFYELGLKTAIVNFDVKPRMAGESKFNFMSLMGLALNGITSFSIFPLRIVACLGFLMAVFAFLIGVALLSAVLFIPGLHSMFKIASLSAIQIVTIFILAFLNLPFIQWVKKFTVKN